MTKFRWTSGSCSNVGNVRERNEDSILERPEVGIWAIADGMGGHDRGDYASSLTVSTLPTTSAPVTLNERIQQIADAATLANKHLVEFAKNRNLCGTTLTAIAVVNGLMACLWVGDSRAYLWRDATLEQITNDHTQFQEMATSGSCVDISNIPADYSHVLTRAIGSSLTLEIDLTEVTLIDGDVIIICSDGLYDELDDAAIAHVVATTQTPQQTAQQMVGQALKGDCSDNVSVIVIHFEQWD